MHRVILVTNDHRFASATAGALAGANVIVSTAGLDLEDIEEALAKGGAAAVILDARDNAPMDASLAAVKEQPGLEEVPIIAVLPKSALAALPNPLIDDFVFDPPNLQELTARVLTRLIRSESLEEGSVIRFEKIEVDIDNYRVKINGKPIELTYKEFELLRFLLTHKGRVFTREALLNRVWGYDYFGSARTVDVHIRRLRSKLGPYENNIETVRNVGYRFSEGS